MELVLEELLREKDLSNDAGRRIVGEYLPIPEGEAPWQTITSKDASEARRRFIAEEAGGRAELAGDDKLRQRDFPLLDETSAVYLDYTGAMLAPHTLVEAHGRVLLRGVLGNPHSAGVPSLRASNQDRAARHAVLKHFKADSGKYDVIWTPNASGAFKLIAEAFPFQPGSRYLYAPDSHNSVIGIRRFALDKGAKVSMVDFDSKTGGLEWDMEHFRAKLIALEREREAASTSFDGCPPPSLLVLPGQSNSSGFKHTCLNEIVPLAQAKGWNVFLDAAALAPTGGLDLSACTPDFVSVSFYKMFGYPTGIGALIAKKDALRKMKRPWFAGGNVNAVSAYAKAEAMVPSDEPAHYEDGTINFTSVSAVRLGIEWFRENVGDGVLLRERIASLLSWTYSQLQTLSWSTGVPLFFIPTPKAGSESIPASNLALLPIGPNGKLAPASLIEIAASRRGISLRSGFFCNPGTQEYFFQYAADKKLLANGDTNFIRAIPLAREEMSYKTDCSQLTDASLTSAGPSGYREGSAQDTLPVVPSPLEDKFHPSTFVEEHKELSLLRVSLGVPTNFRDVWLLICFLREDIIARETEFAAAVQAWSAKPVGDSLCSTACSV